MHLQVTIAVALAILRVSGFDVPLVAGKKCNPHNESETLAWNGTNWEFDGICPPSFVCYDFKTTTAKFPCCTIPGGPKNRVKAPPKKITRRYWSVVMTYVQPPSSSHGSDGPANIWEALGVVAFTVVIVFLCMLCGAYWA